MRYNTTKVLRCALNSDTNPQTPRSTWPGQKLAGGYSKVNPKDFANKNQGLLETLCEFLLPYHMLKKSEEKNNPLKDSLSQKEIEAIVSLLVDSDTHTEQLVKEKLKEMGPHSISALRQFTQAKNSDIQKKLVPIFLDLERKELEEQFTRYLTETTTINLEEGAFLLAKSRYPDIQIEKYRSFLDQSAEKIKESILHNEPPSAIIQKFNQYLFSELGFQGNSSNYHDPENSYLNRVIDKKKGIPISLSSIYLFLARRIDLPIVGIAMPLHFLVAFGEGKNQLLIDPFHQGKILKPEDCIQFLNQSGISFQASFLEPVSDREILSRMLKNLQTIHSQTNAKPDLQRINRFLSALV